MIAIIIFSLAAVFLGLRLYSVLGSRTGHEQSVPRPDEKAVPPLADARLPNEPRDLARSLAQTASLAEEKALVGIRAISAADRSFQIGEFVEGAKSAYAMILEAFWKGEIESVAPYVSEEVRAAFAAAADERAEAGEVMDNRLIAIERAVISAAELADGTARITVRFDADIAAVTRDKAGTVVAGSMTDAITTHDEWTFQRDLRSADPNWMLVETDEA